MMRLSEEQRTGIIKWLPEQAEELFKAGDVNEIIYQLDMLSITLMTDDYEPTDASREVERLMDAIAWDNTHDEYGNKLP